MLLTAIKVKRTCNKALDNYAHALEFVPDCYETKKISNAAVNTYPSGIQFIPDLYSTHKMYVKAVDNWPYYMILNVW